MPLPAAGVLTHTLYAFRWRPVHNVPAIQLRHATLAGVDLLMLPDDIGASRGARRVKEAILSNICADGAAATCASKCIPKARIDEAARRVLILKDQSGLLIQPTPLNGATCGYPGKVYPTAPVYDLNKASKKNSVAVALLAAEKSQVRHIVCSMQPSSTAV